MTEGRILVVDDDVLIRETLLEALLDAGHEARAAGNGREALTLLESWRPDLIVLDLMMPVMDGVTFRAEQRRRPALRAIPVLILSASRRLWTDAAAIAPAAVIEKPFNLDALLGTVEELLAPAPVAATG